MVCTCVVTRECTCMAHLRRKTKMDIVVKMCVVEEVSPNTWVRLMVKKNI